MSGTQNRGQLAHFLAKPGETTYDRLAKGYTDMESTLNPQTREATYIDDSSDSTTTGFQVSYSISGNYYDEDPANMLLFDMSVRLVKGPEAVLSLVEAHLWREHETVSGTYEGFKQECTWVPESSGGGAGGDTVTYGGSLNGKGDRVHGWVTIDKSVTPWTATFSETEPTY